MSTGTLVQSKYFEVVSRLPEDTVVTFQGVRWEEYECLLDLVGEASGLRISYDDGELEVMTLSAEHEKFVRFLEKLMTIVTLRFRVNILSFGSATMRKQRKGKGNEPDACFYVQSAPLIGNRLDIDFETDPPPDIAVEIDVHHGSLKKLPIYVALGVVEVWRFDGETLTMSRLENDRYVPIETSVALPMLTGTLLTNFLGRLRDDGEFQALLAFDEWATPTVK